MNAITRIRIAVVGLLSAAALVGATAMVTVHHPQNKALVAEAAPAPGSTASPSLYEHSGG
jgi:hypothetical protein